jgi:hypothetical protein
MTGQKREDLINAINRAFNVRNIRRTAQRLAGARIDVLTMLERLDLLGIVTRQPATAYRRSVGIPDLNREILTLAFRTALFGSDKPTPLALQIYSGTEEAVEIKTTPRLIEVTLIRVDPPEFQRRRPRSR